MNTHKLPGLALAIAATLPLLAQAQDSAMATIEVAESAEYGEYLTTAEGETLYLFVNEEADSDEPERMTEGVREAAAPCSGGCLEAWPPVTAATVEAGEGVDEELLYTTEVNGQTQAVYNGWPLYRFQRDTAPNQINGQGMGQEPNHWYILSPEGEKIEEDA